MVDSDYDRKLLLLNKILQDGITKLLFEAKTKNYLDPPYGRLPNPTPLITEDQFIQGGGIHCDDSPPEFNFEYGFDPLKYIADFIMWSHPETIENRRLEKVKAATYLQKRAEHAKKQLFTAQSLLHLAAQQRSGILWGPFTSPLSNTSILCICRPIKIGKVIIQISMDKSFSNILHTIEHKVEASERGTTGPIPVKVVINDLIPSTRYYIRCCLSSNSFIKVPSNKPEEEQSVVPLITEEEIEEELKLDFPGVWGNIFIHSEFQVLPSESSEPAPVVVEDSFKLGGPGRKKSAIFPNQSTKEENISIGLAYETIVLNCFGQLALDNYLKGGYVPNIPILSSSSSSSKNDLEDKLPHKVSNSPEVSILLGDVMQHMHDDDQHAALTGTGRTVQSKEESAISYENDLIKLFVRCPLFNHNNYNHATNDCNTSSQANMSLRYNSFVLGWRDGSDGSNYALRAEELAYKQYLHEYKRHQKKLAKSSSRHGNEKGKHTGSHLPPGPVLKRLPLTDSVTALLRDLPITLELYEDNHATNNVSNSSKQPSTATTGTGKTTHNPPSIENIKACRMMYRSLLMGPDVILIILDIRGRGSMGEYLGREQAQWLTTTLTENAAIQWKIIICGKSFGIVGIPPKNAEDLASAVAAKIEADNNIEENEDISAYNIENFDGVQSLNEADINEVAIDDASLVMIQSKQVQLPNADIQDHVTITASIVEDKDDLYGRSLYSLQHILAQLQQTHSGISIKSPRSSSDSAQVVLLTSGIVVLTSGLGSVCKDVAYNSTIDAITHLHLQQDVITPAYVSVYSTLSAPSIKDSSNDIVIDSLRLPSHNDIFADALEELDQSSFCAEISLGSVSNEVLRNNNNCDFYFRDGFQATTLYSALDLMSYDTQLQLTNNNSNTDKISCCKLELLSNGKLQLKLFDRSDYIDSNALLYECIFESPVPSLISINE